MFELLQNALSKYNCFDTLEKVSDFDLEYILKEDPLVPLDYISFLKEIGWGADFSGEMWFFKGVFPSTELSSDDDTEVHRSLSHILFFAYDSSGDQYGFDTKDNFKIVQVDPSDWEPMDCADSLQEFLLTHYEDALEEDFSSIKQILLS
ncbi:MAG: hypothetical protein CMD81_10315 [Gammaproteobacteria bacterium]|nr:hypothetical protein [Gammaproteobacteria bacterium]HBF09403.1 hypothetical protein [Gammaproteobacteria bacterium]|tara:strand:- start:339 stop:785 length:447 start_codon:yes stop_codon:yes gene_type:complete